jgi:eukaryotic-like serine/threonine-protein kinase
MANATRAAQVPTESSWADDDLADDDSRRLLQTRLALVFIVFSGVSVFFALNQLVATVLYEKTTSPLAVALSTLSVGAMNGVLAYRYRKGERSYRELRWVEALTTAATCWMVAALLTQVRPPTEASISLQLSVTYVLMTRAVLLPSAGVRTVVVCVLALVPAGIVATWLRAHDLPATATVEDWLFQTYMVFRTLVITGFLAALTSHVIYGLRRRVQQSARIGQYVLREKLGEGGMGVVYRATHALLRRDTAVKLLLPTRVRDEDVGRFEREVTRMAQLTHPNTVAVFDYGRTPAGVFYYAMEYLEGGDLERLVEYTGALPPARVIWILEQMCRALAEAHAQGLVHRDIKPSNVLLCERGREGDVTKVLDFGLVKDLNAAADGLSRADSLAGSPLYMSPESIVAPELVDPRADLYSLGATAYFLLTGRPPFTGNTIVEVCAAHLHHTPPPPSEQGAGIGAELDGLILRCLQKDPSSRFPDALALRQALLECPSASSWDARRAAEWWSAHRDRFRAHCQSQRSQRATAQISAGADTEFGSALQIDHDRRLAASRTAAH